MATTSPVQPTDRLWLDLTVEPLDPAAALAFLSHERAGGTSIFVGTPRRWTGDVETPWLDYEAYVDMAVHRLDELASEAVRRWSPLRLVAHHRLGRVRPEEPSVVVGVACAHRAEAFEASRWLIDTIKSDVPIWKRDCVPDASPQHASWL